MKSEEQIMKAKQEDKTIKCVVWDLDNTIWNGVLLEDSHVILRDGIMEIIKEIDKRGILQSIASKNHFETVEKKLAEFKLWDYFLYPEINWNDKSESINRIAQSLNLSLDTFAFVDDQPFEREEVTYNSPEVLCIDSADVNVILDMPRMNPKFITKESRLRRKLYRSDILRNIAEDYAKKNNENFMSTLELVFTIKKATEEDLKRAEELTIRTHQLNTTGYTYSYDELDAFRQSKNHLLYVARLEDRFGTYGTIGLCLVEKKEDKWVIKLLLMSCRVMSRGVGSVFLSYIMKKAKEVGAKLYAEFISNDRNRMMYVTYKFAGFIELHKSMDIIVLESNLENIPPVPDYVSLQIF